MPKSTKVFNVSIGKLGEALAAEYLCNLGYKLIQRNFRVGRLGEIDIIAKQGSYICFVEVKTRRGLNYGRPSESVTPDKQRRIIRLANVFLQNNKMLQNDVRFDVVEVLLEKGRNNSFSSEITLITNAFGE